MSLKVNVLVMFTLMLFSSLTQATSLDPGLRSGLEDPMRPAADKARDEGRKPASVITFLGIAPGMTVLDLLAAGGYYTEVLSWAVGPQGKVYAQNSKFLLEMRDGANEKALSARLENNRLANVERINADLTEMGLEPASIDAATLVLNFHDIYNSSAESAVDLLKLISGLLTPGGVLGIIDHAGVAGNDNAKLHRIEKSLVIDAIEASGMVLEAQSDLLANPDDDMTGGVFGPDVRGATNRFLFRVRNPG